MCELPRRLNVPKRYARIGFTLIELLVVIAIIALLVSILLPSLQRAQELAKRVTCASSLRRVGMAFVYYADANDQLLPRPAYWGGGHTNGIIWWSAVGQYCGGDEAWTTPGNGASWDDLTAAGIRCPGYDYIQSGYGMSLYVPPMNGSIPAWTWPRMDLVDNPSGHPLVADADDWHLADWWDIKYTVGWHGRHRFDVERHNDTCCVVFVGGNVGIPPASRFLGNGSDLANEQAVWNFFLGL